MLDLEKVDDLLDLAAIGELLASRASDPDGLLEEGRAHLQIAAGHDVVEHAHPAEQRNILERPRNALRGCIVRVHVAPRCAAKRDRALLRVVDAVDDVQQRALPCAVRTDDRAHLMLAHVEGDVGERLDAAEGKRDIFQLQNDVADAARGHAMTIRRSSQRSSASLLRTSSSPDFESPCHTRTLAADTAIADIVLLTRTKLGQARGAFEVAPVAMFAREGTGRMAASYPRNRLSRLVRGRFR